MNKFCGVGQGNEWEVSGSDKAETEDRRDSLSALWGRRWRPMWPGSWCGEVWSLDCGVWSVPDASELFLSCCLSHGKSPASGTNSLLTTTNVTDQLSSSPACLVIFYLLIIHHQHSHYDGAFLVTWKFKFLTLIKMKCIFNFRWADGTFGQESVGQFMSSLVFLFCS